jgi:cell division initiation protein
MITPQQIDQISFSRATFGGYDMQSVDNVLGPLTEDYVTLYKENSLLKSKMRVLVAKLEEYRSNEESMKDAIVNAQKTCDQMVKTAEEKCTQMLTQANAAAEENAKNADALIRAENDRVEEARRAAADKIDCLTAELNACIQALNRIKAANAPAPIGSTFYDYEKDPDADPNSVMADEIAKNLENLIGSPDDEPAKTEPLPTREAPSKFHDLQNQFGPGYDPTAK